ncbi:MAG: Prophage CP4-57 integrase [Smithella sp. PtaU1.Bin162]|nr:MAG: Prophage CP4-57 integrase [Smithella sp. PtaU1.Bin162]
MKFTDKEIRNLKPKDKMYQKREADGFGIRVLPSGVKIWIFVYAIAGKRRQMNLGDYPDITLAHARGRLLEARKVFKDGHDPQDAGFEWHRNPERAKREAARAAEAELKNPTVRQLALDYMTRHAKLNKRESSWKEDERLLNKNVLPAWGNRKANVIRKSDCVALLDSYADRPALCNNILRLTRKMFNFAIEKDILEFSPFARVKPPVQSGQRDRVLTEDEIRAFWTTELPKSSMSSEVKGILKLALLTGQRCGEICGIRVSEIEDNWWTIPGERTKNGVTHRVYLTESARKILAEVKKNSEYYFESPVVKYDSDNNPIYAHITPKAISYAIRRNLKDYKHRRPINGDSVKMVKVAENRKMEMNHFTPHDLRRTCATFLAKLGFSDEVIDAVLNHKKSGVVKIYNRHKYDNEKQLAMETWERKLESIITNKEGNVIPITAGRKTV